MEKPGKVLGPAIQNAVPVAALLRPGQSNGHFRLPKSLLQELLDSGLIVSEDWAKLTTFQQKTIKGCAGDEETLLPLLIKHGLITEYLASRIISGTTFGLLLGNYRVLD